MCFNNKVHHCTRACKFMIPCTIIFWIGGFANTESSTDSSDQLTQCPAYIYTGSVATIHDLKARNAAASDTEMLQCIWKEVEYCFNILCGTNCSYVECVQGFTETSWLTLKDETNYVYVISFQKSLISDLKLSMICLHCTTSCKSFTSTGSVA